MTRTITLASAVALCLALGACSQDHSPTPQQRAAQQKAANEAKAQEKLKMYQRLVQLNNYPLAVPIGHEIEDQFPGTKAAATVKQSLPKIEAESKAKSEHDRLANMWLYQVGPMGGGTQSTAVVATQGIRLVLRKHSKWGESVFLYDTNNHGFICHKVCSIATQVDGKSHTLKGYRPDGGEPALFIKDYKGFVKMMEKAKKIVMHVDLKQGGKTTLTYEVSGFVPDKWKPAK
ncbi:hypothetical protein [Oleiagrimonas sp. C23AA]|uniref:hypothetical protein n=1 Tax=Oleiagrimonas sp. C23AA TaxID=2719047 RepID=UPI00142061A5|nr:hypothetical protein [Oleiagrimonas sp. C23AA]NII11937.1 hypothetical protein [Oleiagrimonas sp. C23AA]